MPSSSWIRASSGMEKHTKDNALMPCPNCPDIPWLKRRLLAYQFAFIPRHPLSAQEMVSLHRPSPLFVKKRRDCPWSFFAARNVCFRSEAEIVQSQQICATSAHDPKQTSMVIDIAAHANELTPVLGAKTKSKPGPNLGGQVRRLVRIPLRLHSAPRFPTRTVALGARAAEEFGHSRTGPAPALAGGDALGVEMIGDGLGRSHPRRLGGLNFDHEVPHKRFDLLSPLRHSINPEPATAHRLSGRCSGLCRSRSAFRRTADANAGRSEIPLMPNANIA
jgi:hypothetical protein